MKIGKIHIDSYTSNISKVIDCINENFNVVSRQQLDNGDFIFIANHDEFENVENVKDIPKYEIWFKDDLGRLLLDRIEKVESIKDKELNNYNKFDNIMSQFKRSKELYGISPEFHMCVTKLMKGATPYEVIEQMCIVVDDIKEAQIQLINRAKIY